MPRGVHQGRSGRPRTLPEGARRHTLFASPAEMVAIRALLVSLRQGGGQEGGRERTGREGAGGQENVTPSTLETTLTAPVPESR